MTINLKVFYDNVVSADQEVKRISQEIESLLSAGKNDDAAARRDSLLEAKAAYTAANDIYLAVAGPAQPGINNDPSSVVFQPGRVDVIIDEADRPFRSPGEMLQAVRVAAIQPGRMDVRLKSRIVVDATGMSEGIPSDGGFLLDQPVTNDLTGRMWGTGQILQLIKPDPVTNNSNSMRYNGVDETSRANGSRKGGIVAGWIGEGGTIPAGKPTFYPVKLELGKVAAICYATSEQIQDTANLTSWLLNNVPDELLFQVEDAFFEGDGVGKPRGVVGSTAIHSVTRENANQVTFTDLSNMWANRYSGVRDYVWMINQEVGPFLDKLSITVGSSEVPPRFVDYGPDGIMRIKGRPVVETEYNSAVGTAGDILLASWSQYQVIEKANAVDVARSIHVQFLTAEEAFRFIYRVDGKPLWKAPVTPFKGSGKRAPFVALTAAS